LDHRDALKLPCTAMWAWVNKACSKGDFHVLHGSYAFRSRCGAFDSRAVEAASRGDETAWPDRSTAHGLSEYSLRYQHGFHARPSRHGDSAFCLSSRRRVAADLPARDGEKPRLSPAL